MFAPIYYIQVNLMCIFILFIVFLNYTKKTIKLSINVYYFRMLIGSIIFIFFVDIISWIFNGQPGRISNVLMNLSSFLYFAFTGIIAYFGLMYVLDLTNIKLTLKRKFLFFTPAFILCVLSFASMFTNLIFVVDDYNEYFRGKIHYVQIIVAFIYLISATTITIINLHKRIILPDKLLELARASVFVMPIIGGIIQSIWYGTIILWPLTTLSILFLYMLISTHDANYDGLTELYSKTVYEKNARRVVFKHKETALIIIDLDNFKLVNDIYGHKQGDLVLKLTADNLKKHFPSNSLIGRIGGDEFSVTIYNYDNISTVEKQCDDFLHSINNLLSDIAKFNFSCSIGISINERNTPYEIAYQNADNALYITKKNGRNKYTIYDEEYVIESERDTVLIVDDNEINRIILSSYLEGKCNVLEATNGKEALQLISEYRNRIGLVFLDMIMPVMSGNDLIDSIKHTDLFQEFKIIILSVMDMTEDEVNELGVTGFIQKPFEPHIILDLINKYMIK